MDISIEAIEREFATAQANAGRQQEQTALARAQIIATLLAAGVAPRQVVAPAQKYVDQKIDPFFDINPFPQDDVTVAKLDAQDQLPTSPADQSVVQVEDDDIDEDFFAEARKERGH